MTCESRVVRKYLNVFRGGALAALLAMLSQPVAAGPWLDAGDQRLRHDLQLLADEGLIHLPMQSWPLPAADVAYAVNRLSVAQTEDVGAQRALGRVQARVRREQRAGVWRSHLEGGLWAEPEPVRSFAAGSREEIQAGIGAERMGQRFAVRAQAQWADDPEDGDEWRLDGSYLGAVLGNWMISLDTLDRWWGPGWDGSLQLSNNARPFPKLTVQRNYSTPPQSPLLQWVGPWRWTAFLGQLDSNRDPGSPRVFGARLDTTPLPSLHLGLSTTALFGGDGRSENVSALRDVYTGDADDDGDPAGYQLTGADIRWALPVIPVAVYGQYAGQSEDGGSAEEDMTLFGIEAARSIGRRGDTLRVQIEHADLTDVAGSALYDSDVYDVGYRYRDRGIGHSLAGSRYGSSEMTSLTATWVFPDGSSAFVRARSGERADRAGDPATDFDAYHVGYEQRLPDGSRWDAVIGWREQAQESNEEDSEWYGGFRIRQNF